MQDISKNLTIHNVQPATGEAKSHKVWFKDPDFPENDPVLAYASVRDGWTKVDFVKGDDGPVMLNFVKKDDGGGFYGLKSWKGKTNEKKQGAGGGFRGAPKSPGDIAVMQACNVNTSAVAAVNHLATMGMVKTLEDYTSAFKALHAVILADSVTAVNQLKGAVA